MNYLKYWCFECQLISTHSEDKINDGTKIKCPFCSSTKKIMLHSEAVHVHTKTWDRIRQPYREPISNEVKSQLQRERKILTAAGLYIPKRRGPRKKKIGSRNS